MSAPARSGVDVEGQTASSRSGTGPTEPKVESWCGRNDCDVEGDYVDACDVCKLFARLASLAAVVDRQQEALRDIERKARWYADNPERDPHEVDFALCVEVLDIAERALNGVGLSASVPPQASPFPEPQMDEIQ